MSNDVVWLSVGEKKHWRNKCKDIHQKIGVKQRLIEEMLSVKVKVFTLEQREAMDWWMKINDVENQLKLLQLLNLEFFSFLGSENFSYKLRSFTWWRDMHLI